MLMGLGTLGDVTHIGPWSVAGDSTSVDYAHAVSALQSLYASDPTAQAAPPMSNLGAQVTVPVGSVYIGGSGDADYYRAVDAANRIVVGQPILATIPSLQPLNAVTLTNATGQAQTLNAYTPPGFVPVSQQAPPDSGIHITPTGSPIPATLFTSGGVVTAPDANAASNALASIIAALNAQGSNVTIRPPNPSAVDPYNPYHVTEPPVPVSLLQSPIYTIPEAIAPASGTTATTPTTAVTNATNALTPATSGATPATPTPTASTGNLLTDALTAAEGFTLGGMDSTTTWLLIGGAVVLFMMMGSGGSGGRRR